MQKIDQSELAARAFGEDSAAKPEARPDPKETTAADAPQAESGESKEKGEKAAPEPVESAVDEQKVPYSRLRTAIEKSRAAEREAVEYRSKYEELSRQRAAAPSSEPYAEGIASRIRKLYGDNDTSKEIIELELARQRQIEEIAERKAYEAYDRRESGAKAETEANERIIETRLEDLSLSVGRDITPQEEEEVLAIADQYSPVGDDGKYLSGEPLPLDRAWEIYEMKLASRGQASKKARSQATALTGSRSEGETAIEPKDSDSWYPGRWRSRFKN